MKRTIIFKGFTANIDFETNEYISFEKSNLILSHDVSRFITSSKIFQEVADCISSFFKGNWGCIHEDDIPLNNTALKTGDRILGAYPIDKTKSKIWIIADASDSPKKRIITILFPDEY